MNTKKLIFALLVSLTLNLFLLGMGVGFFVAKPKHDFPTIHQSFKYPPRGMSPQMRQVMRTKHKELRGNRQEINRLKQNLKKVLQQESLNMHEINQLFQEINELRATSASLSQSATMSAIESMTYEERVEFSKKIFKRGRPRPPKPH